MSSDPTVLRVALRYALATTPRQVFASGGGFFQVGDLVLYGRWKNHHGKILRFSSDNHGNPVVEIEPIPKGRKQNKVMQLFKIWHDPPPALRVPQPPGAVGPAAASSVVIAEDEND